MRERSGTLGSLGLSALALACAANRAENKQTAAPAPAAKIEWSQAQARHALNRLAFGPTPGEVAKVHALGFERWLDHQLDGKVKEEPIAELEPYADALAPPVTLVERALGDDFDMNPKGEKGLKKRLKKGIREHVQALAMAELTRHISSSRQLREVLTDFWTNHFNVFARKGLVQLFAGDYIERAIRPNALGRFEDLLVATARHPAMLLYLDNARSVRDQEMPAQGKKRRGLNENYARELLELHTLGVDGGYTQADVIDVARILTGYSVTQPRDGKLEFTFRERAHDRGEKKVLGRRFPAGGGEEEGRALLSLLAAHPSTARHLSQKLAARLVADDPPKACVDAGARAYLESKGDIGRTLRAIVTCDEFFQKPGEKLKSPLELVVSAARAVGAKPDGSLRLARTLVLMGQPILLEPVPTGYPEAEADWLGSSGMLARMSFASALAAEELRGLEVDLDRALVTKDDDVASKACRQLLGENAPKRVVTTIQRQLEGVADADERRALAVALVIGSPEFQRQ
jgi:uncharacterized protein (DUF1800 family)